MPILEFIFTEPEGVQLKRCSEKCGKNHRKELHESRFNKVVVYSPESLLKRTHCEVFQKRLCRTPVNRCICLLSFSLILLSLVCFSMFLQTVTKYCFCYWVILTLSWRRPSSYRNQSIDLQSKSSDWFLYDNGLRNEGVKWAV